MRLSRITISNFRRIREAEVTFSGATFLIGQNNYGKSSVMRAVELLLSQTTPDPNDFHVDVSDNRAEEICLLGEFTDVDAETANARGFKGRVVNGVFRYRKTYKLSSKKPKIECLAYPYTVRSTFSECKTARDLVSAGIEEEIVIERFGTKLDQKLKRGWEQDILDHVAEFDTAAEPEWVENPGGIPGNVLSRLPRVLHVPPLTKEGDVGDADKKTIVSEVLGILFEDLLAGNELAESIQDGLSELQSQMAPETDGSIIQTLCTNVNQIIKSVFPGCGIKIDPSLQDMTSVIKPKYSISLFSNTETDVSRQGTGLLRTAVFSMLRYHTQLKADKEMDTQPLLVCFEEPELFLHPAAANLLRDTIYALGESDQIVCTTHSPWMIDLARDPQSLTKMVIQDDGAVSAVNYEVSKQLASLQDDDRARVKMLQLFDDELSRVFFSDRVVVVEGDTEEVVFKETLKRFPESVQKYVHSSTQVVKARGKAAIISLVRYLNALAIDPVVVHDRDQGTAGAERFNPIIAAVVGDADRLCILEECIEDALGYPAPSSDKPFRAYRATALWTGLEDVPTAWRDQFMKAIGFVQARMTVLPPEVREMVTDILGVPATGSAKISGDE